MRTPDHALLLDMLRYRRPHASRTEEKFINRFLMPLDPYVDEEGNLIISIGSSNVMWSCHTDTVHREEGKQLITAVDGLVALAPGSKSNCLGADDTAGVWLMHQMITFGIPGLYIFHRGEEVGGIGSRAIAKENPEYLQGIDIAIALDRKGTGDIITHQGTRCCSDAFAASLAEQLTGFTASPNGIFTDTANYTDLIAECTNLSVGYGGAHGPNECLDMWFLDSLFQELCDLDTTKLVVSRKAGEDDVDYGYNWRKTYDLYSDDYIKCQYGDLASLVKQYPDIAADILDRLGYDEEQFLSEVFYIR